MEEREENEGCVKTVFGVMIYMKKEIKGENPRLLGCFVTGRILVHKTLKGTGPETLIYSHGKTCLVQVLWMTSIKLPPENFADIGVGVCPGVDPERDAVAWHLCPLPLLDWTILWESPGTFLKNHPLPIHAQRHVLSPFLPCPACHCYFCCCPRGGERRTCSCLL